MRFLNRYKIDTIDYVANQKKSVEIPRTGVLLGLNFNLTFTITNGGTAPSGATFFALAALMKRIELKAGGSDTPVNTTGPALAAKQYFDFGQYAQGSENANIVYTTSAATTYRVHLYLPLFLPRHRVPDETGLPLFAIPQTTLTVTWGSISDIFGTTNSAALSNVSLDVSGEFHVGVDPARSYKVREFSIIEKELTATQSNFRIELQPNNQPVFVRNVDTIVTVAGAGDNSVLDDGSLKIVATPTEFQEIDGRVCQAHNRRRYSLDEVLAGFYRIDTEMFGENVDQLDARVFRSDLNLILDATKQSGTNLIQVHPELIRNIRI
jgi:hypothetical protein